MYAEGPIATEQQNIVPPPVLPPPVCDCADRIDTVEDQLAALTARIVALEKGKAPRKHTH